MNIDENIGMAGLDEEPRPARKKVRVRINRPDEVLFQLLYSVKFCTDKQAYQAAYFQMSYKGCLNRIHKLKGAGYINIRQESWPKDYTEEFDPPPSVQIEGEQNRPSRTGAGRPPLTYVLYLAGAGEMYLRDLRISQRMTYHAAGPVKPHPRENWAHELAISRLLVDQLGGDLDERWGEFRKWNWLTTYRYESADLRHLKVSRSNDEIGYLAPDSIVTHELRPEARLFIEMDRGTKPLFRQRDGRGYRDTIRANFQAYGRLFSRYEEFFQDKRQPLLVYVVRTAERRRKILELAGKEIPGVPMRVRIAETAMRWFEDWAAGKNDAIKGAINKNAMKPEEASSDQLQTLLSRIDTIEGLRKNILIKEAMEVFTRLGAKGVPLSLSAEWELLMRGGK